VRGLPRGVALIAYGSTFMTLKSGDVIVTGTPAKLGRAAISRAGSWPAAFLKSRRPASAPCVTR